MESYDAAVKLAKRNFHVLPILKNGKKPIMDDFPKLATTSEAILDQWFHGPYRDCNVGISTTIYNGSQALLVVDIDVKNGKDGFSDLLKLELEGKIFPPTLTQRSPSGGEHLIYWCRRAVKQSVGKLAPGLDIRSKGGCIVGAGSEIDGVAYTFSNDLPIAEAPEWLVIWCGFPQRKTKQIDIGDVDDELAKSRAIKYLETAEIAIEGNGGDAATLRVCHGVLDQGVDKVTALEVLLNYWNYKCLPPWDTEELLQKVENACAYRNDPVGVKAPEKIFKPVGEAEVKPPSPKELLLSQIQAINSQYAFLVVGSKHAILWESYDAEGKKHIQYLEETTFHKLHASKTIIMGTDKPKMESITKLWVAHPSRRTYSRGVVFRPKQLTPPDFYNLWRGFHVDPMPEGAKAGAEATKSLDMWLEHLFENICNYDRSLFEWLVCYCAHLVQRPWEKPHTAIVLRGKKGVGKNALVDRLGYLFGENYLEIAKADQLMGKFNAHMERLLMVTLNEAFWSGDKAADGVLKHTVTGSHHLVEHKFIDSYRVKNLMRVFIIGNERWLAPASEDERRYAVFNVGEKRREDINYFRKIQNGMERDGGYELLLRYLLNYDLSNFEPNIAPKTEGLAEQKILSMNEFHQWWFACLQEGRIVDSDMGDEWPAEVPRSKFRSAFLKNHGDRKIRSRIPHETELGKYFKDCCPSHTSIRPRKDENRGRCYQLPSLAQARSDWDKFIGHVTQWEI